ncbi:hypothetical protein [Actinocorallia longicatena]|uniref:Amidotransferase n=1 Tax=Actinocorallia longicatena TaxID=111803 RepID=A0ABP6QN11_9ACTN
MTLLLFAVAGFLAAGVYSLAKQGLKAGAVVVGLLAVLAAVAAVLWR